MHRIVINIVKAGFPAYPAQLGNESNGLRQIIAVVFWAWGVNTNELIRTGKGSNADEYLDKINQYNSKSSVEN